MEFTKEEREKIQNEVREKLNEILENNELPYRVDRVSVMNTSTKTCFIGSVRVHNPNKIKKVYKEVESLLNSYGPTTIKTQRVVPCCETPFENFNFNLEFKKE